MRKRSSIVWKISKQDLKELISKSETYKEVLSELGLVSRTGGNYKTLKKRIQEENLDVSHIEQNKKSFRGPFVSKAKPISEYLVKNKECDSRKLKRRLIKNNLLEEECSECGCGTIWNDKPLSLQLDHIDGDHTNNTLENLRILCPNCHTQTKTFGSKNSRKYLETRFCKCGAKKMKDSKTCKKCSEVPEKICWPSNEELQALLWKEPTSSIAKKLGVSDSAIGKRVKKLGLTKPPRGYWMKQSS